jgi:hypothetical protein
MVITRSVAVVQGLSIDTLFSVYSDTGEDLCQGGSKRYFSCNIQVGDGLLVKNPLYV